MISTRDCVTRENHWQIASLVTKKSVINGKLYFILYPFYFVNFYKEGPTKLRTCMPEVDIKGRDK